MKWIIIVLVLVTISCNNVQTEQVNRYAGRKYEVVSMNNPMNGYCEYQLYGWSTPTIVDTIGKYHIGQIITLK